MFSRSFYLTATVVLASFWNGAFAADPALKETIPAGVQPVAEEKQLLDSVAPRVGLLKVTYDDGGHVKALMFSNHEAKSKLSKDRPGFGDADAPVLKKFPKLTSLLFEKQPITEKGLEVLRELNLEEVGFHYMPPGIDPKFPAVINGKNLRRLEIKHNFKAKVDLSGISSSFPDLKYLVLDTTAAGPQCLELLPKMPAIECLELHRPKLTSEQFGKLVDMVPNVRWIEIKADIGGAGSLRHLQRFSKLEVLALHQWKTGNLPFQGGLEHLVPIKTLKHLNAESYVEKELLAKARPDVEMGSRENPWPRPRTASGEEFVRW